jgi:hypothetical protein
MPVLKLCYNFQRYVSKAWWDPKLDNSSKKPQYFYDAESDKWSPQWKKAEIASRKVDPESDSSIPESLEDRSSPDTYPSLDSTKHSHSVWKRLKRRFSFKK